MMTVPAEGRLLGACEEGVERSVASAVHNTLHQSRYTPEQSVVRELQGTK